MEAQLYARLSTWTGLAGVKIYPVTMPSGAALPAITYQLIGATRYIAADRNPGIARNMVQVTAFARSYKQARDVAEQIRLALERWRSNDDNILDTYIVGEHDLYEPDTAIYSRNITAEIIHREGT